MKITHHDLRAFVAAAHNLVRGRDIYLTHHRAVPEDQTIPKDVPIYCYPPLVAMAMIPATLVKFKWFRWLWSVLSVAAMVHAVWLFADIVPSKDLLVTVIVGLTLLLFAAPFRWQVATGQIDGILMWLTVAGFHAATRGDLKAGAVLMSVAACAKITPALPLLFVCRVAPIEFTIYAAATCGLLLAIQLPFGLLRYLFELLPHIARWQHPPPFAQSIRAMFGRNVLAESLIRAMVICSVVLFFIRPDGAVLSGFAVSLSAMALLPNIGWTMQFILVVPALMIGFACVSAGWYWLVIPMLAWFGREEMSSNGIVALIITVLLSAIQAGIVSCA